MRHAASSLIVLWVILMILFLLVFVPAVEAQAVADQPGSENAVCSFEDGKQVSVRYVRAAVKAKDALPLGKMWTPAGAPLLLFTETRVSLGNAEIAPGAYRLLLVPGKEDWTLIVSNDVRGGAYDGRQDLLRARMEVGELNEADKWVMVYFGLVGPRACDMRVDYGKTRAWIEFTEK